MYRPPPAFRVALASVHRALRGILLGCSRDRVEVLSWELGTFFVAASVRQRTSRVGWMVVSVYGPADHDWAAEFLEELQALVARCDDIGLPMVLGGDFNLICSSVDKSSDNIDWPHVDLFNGAIADMAQREVPRVGARYTWTNKQVRPIRSVLDRVFFTPAWEVLFPLASLLAETRLGSDHVPLILSSGEDKRKRSPRFFFESAWFESVGFEALVRDQWARVALYSAPRQGPMERWCEVASRLRSFLRGWGANRGRAEKRERATLTQKIARLDLLADTREFSKSEWAHRYSLENKVLAIIRAEEE